MGQIRTQSTAVLDDLRRPVGLMREDAEAPRSVASLAAVPELVDQRRAGGVPVELRTQSSASGRTVGEGIGTLAQLVDDRRDEALLLTVTNGPGRPGPSSTGGFGLVGMQERADLLGATLRYGATADGGWQVQVEIPRDLTGRGGPLPGPQKEEAR